MSKYITKSLYVDYKKFPKLARWKVNNPDRYKTIRKIEDSEQEQHIIQLGQQVEDAVAEYLKKKTWSDIINLFPDIPKAEEIIDEDEDETFWVYYPTTKNYYELITEAVEKTNQAIKDKQPLLYQPSFLVGNCFVRADFMVLNSSGRYDLIEVKAKTGVRKDVTHEKIKYNCWDIKPDLKDDVSFQRYVVNTSLKEQWLDEVENFYIYSLNKEYVKQWPIKIFKLIKEDKLDTQTVVSIVGEKKDREVERNDWLTPQVDIERVVKNIEEDIVLDEESFNKKYPFPWNKYLEHFGKDKLGEFGTILAIPRMHFSLAPTVAQLYKQGTIDIMELTDMQKEMFSKGARDFLEKYIQSKNSWQPLILKEFIKEELSHLQYPICFYDYETISVPIPFLDKTYPYQQVVVQYSLHKVYEDGTMKHYGGILGSEVGQSWARLVEIKNNPNAVEYEQEKVVSWSYKDLLNEFLKDIWEDINYSSFVVWNKAFENTRNKEVGEIFPDLQDSYLAINEKTYDLMDVFSKGLYFDLWFKWSASIKKVLPVLVPEMSYEWMEVGNGSIAMKRLQELIEDKLENRDKVIEDLLRYCGQDSLAMVKIREILINL